jgi:hypothetical protein
MISWLPILELQFDPTVTADRTVLYSLDVDGSGRVTACTIARSSGDEKFDRSICYLLTSNAAFDVSSSGPGHFDSGLSIPGGSALALARRAQTPSGGRGYQISAFIEADGRVSACRWRGGNAPEIDAWRLCNRSSWVDRRDTNGNLVRGVVEIGVSQQEIDEIGTEP